MSDIPKVSRYSINALDRSPGSFWMANFMKVYDDSRINFLSLINLKGQVNCVRWDQNGKMLATCSLDTSVKITDFGSEKVLHETKSQDDCK